MKNNFSATIYNGSDWSVSEINVKISNIKSNISKEYVLKPYSNELRVSHIEPYSNGNFKTKSVGAVLNNVTSKDEFSWMIVSAKGFK